MFVVIAGSPIDGYRHFGPFTSDEEATTWGENNQDRITGEEAAAHAEWWVAPLTRP